MSKDERWAADESYLPEVCHSRSKWALSGDVSWVTRVVVHLRERKQRVTQWMDEDEEDINILPASIKASIWTPERGDLLKKKLFDFLIHSYSCSKPFVAQDVVISVALISVKAETSHCLVTHWIVVHRTLMKYCQLGKQNSKLKRGRELRSVQDTYSPSRKTDKLSRKKFLFFFFFFFHYRARKK